MAFEASINFGTGAIWIKPSRASELLYTTCHRRFIADALHERRHIVIHILDDTRSYEHKGADRTLDEFLGDEESLESE